MTMAPFPPGNPFAESVRDSTGAGPDFPGSGGDREQGKFRPSRRPRLTGVAVVDDDGRPAGSAAADDVLMNILTELRGIRIGMERLLAVTDDGNDYDLLDLALSEDETDS